jgi:hypothetical protein
MYIHRILFKPTISLPQSLSSSFIM